MYDSLEVEEPTRPPIGPFAPINPGNLSNCVPPCELSATGDIAYLRALLEVPVDGGDLLGDAVAERRGPVGELAATSANATVRLPLLDLVNECLESVTATGDAVGAVHDTDLHDAGDHDPEAWCRAVPSYSSPATPVVQSDAYALLSKDFSAPCLPYSQELDVNRRHLEVLGTTRYDVMRGFREEITEFVLDRDAEPAEFPRHVWRYPLRLPLALEHLCLSREEYDALFSGPLGEGLVAELYGYAADAEDWARDVLRLSELLVRLGLAYCDFHDLVAAGLVEAHVRVVGNIEAAASLPECEPCCLGDYVVFLGEGGFGGGGDLTILGRLAVVVRLWRKLRCRPGHAYTFAELVDIVGVLGMDGGADGVDPDFVPQLAALLLLREREGFDDVPLGDLLDLWRDPTAVLDDDTSATFVDHVAGRAGALWRNDHRAGLRQAARREPRPAVGAGWV